MKSDGSINYVNALVGREGKFWARNITLSGTTNLAITVADLAGNTLDPINVPVVQGSSGLTIAPVTPGNPTVTGSVNINGTVTVNGVAATRNPTNNSSWTAQITPIGVSGGVVLARCGSEGCEYIVDPPQGIFLTSLHTLDARKGDYLNKTDWDDGRGGFSSWHTFCYYGWDLQDAITWPASTWPQAVPGGTPSHYNNGVLADSRFGEQPFSTNPVAWDMPYCVAGCDSVQYSSVDTQYSDYGVLHTVRTNQQFMLATGGPIGSTQKNLWCLTVSALSFDTLEHLQAYEVYGYGGTPVPPDQITVGAFGHPDENGQIWVALSDNDPPDVTPSAPEFEFACFTLTGATTKGTWQIVENTIDVNQAGIKPGAEPQGYSVSYTPGIGEITDTGTLVTYQIFSEADWFGLGPRVDMACVSAAE